MSAKTRIPLAERFWARVDTDGPAPEHRPELGPCWLWTGAHVSDGYGSLRVEGVTVGAHRVAWVLAFGPIPDGLGVLHRCDRRDCQRPAHLFLGTQLTNVRDMHAKGRANKAHGDRNGSRLHPERRPRGDAHAFRRHPELMARGDRSGARLHPETRARGERNGSARLTEAQVAAIRVLLSGGNRAYSAIGRGFGVSKTTIRDIALGRRWRQS